MNTLLNSIRAFAVEEDGAQIVEYALIIAMVSIVLAGLLATAFTGGGDNMFQSFVDRVAGCLAGNAGVCNAGGVPPAAP
jgi:pilus assembly protein Flp/PilA